MSRHRDPNLAKASPEADPNKASPRASTLPKPGVLSGLPPLPPREAFYVLAESRQLTSKPISRTLFEVPVVLFRGRGGKAQTFLDRCPHRNVPLSAGRVRNEELECPYHGWRFGEGGECTRVPGLLEADPSRASRRVACFETIEASGYVWVRGIPSGKVKSERQHDAEVSQEQHEYTPFPFPFADDPRYSTVRHVFDFDGSPHAVAENALDVPHTAFLHAGLFRRESQRSRVDVEVRRGPGFVEAEYSGEPRPDGVLGRLLAPQGGEVEHVDRFFLPSIAQVEYRLGESHVVATTALTPTEADRTRMFATVSFKLPMLPNAKLGEVVGNFLKPLALTVLKQDAAVLSLQSKNLTRFEGARFASTQADVLGPEITRLLSLASRRAVRTDYDASGEPVSHFEMEV